MTKKKTLNTAIAAGLSGLVLLASSVQAQTEALSLQGKTIGVAVVGTQHFWDREAFKGASSEVEKLGGKVVAVDGGRDNQVHAGITDFQPGFPGQLIVNPVFGKKEAVCLFQLCI